MNKIVLVSPSLKMGGIERALTVLAQYFVEQGNQVVFICCLRSEKFYQLHPDVKIIEPVYKRTGGRLNRFFYYPRLVGYLRKNIRKEQPDTVLSFGDIFNPLVLLATVGLKYPVYISDRTSPDFAFKFPVPQLKKWLYPLSAGFIAQTHRSKKYKEKQFNHRLNIRVIPNAVRDIRLSQAKTRKKIILYAGRFSWEKDPAMLINAFHQLSNRQGWTLMMAGSGPLLASMKQLAITLGIEKEINFLGDVNNMDDLYAQSGIFVLPSVLEGFPNSLVEAMSAGLPVIVFDTIAHEDFIQNGYDGIVVANRNAYELSKQIQVLIEDEKMREQIGINAIKIYERLNANVVGQTVLKFITTK